MNTRINMLKKLISASSMSAVVFCCVNTNAADLALVDEPLFLNASVPPLNMMVLGRDHKLFMAAYNDASDLNGDGTLDVGYRGYMTKADGTFLIDYFGYFDSLKCYTYAANVFSPSYKTANKKCTAADAWSGDYLNYLTTSRMDALRKVLYGGYRSTDPATGTVVLERAYIPQDAHSWGKEYKSIARDGYDIADYTGNGIAAPVAANQYILFANTTLSNTLLGNARNPTGQPLLRVMSNTNFRVWEWLSKEAPVAGDTCANPGSWSTVACGTIPADYTVRVEVCKSATLKEDNCKTYPNNSLKPTGLLHDYGANDLMYFGLLSGSYASNLEGGVIRKQIASFKDEFDANTGKFVSPKKGIMASLDGFKIQDYDGIGTYSHNHNCNSWTNPQANGNCGIWGNPMGEMMYESLRYFAGASNSQYQYTNAGSDDNALGLPQVTAWTNPYSTYPACSKPFDMIISDVNASYDSNLPGNPWVTVASSTQPSLAALNVSTLGQSMWNNEFNATAPVKSIFIGEVGATANGAPSYKDASSFGNIRGLSPEEPTRQGTYYSSAVAYFGRTNDINAATNVKGKAQNLNTFSVALSSPLPRMEIPVGGKIITLVPFGKVIDGPGSISAAWQPTEQIVAFYIDTMENMTGQTINAAVNGGRPKIRFRINYEDAEEGSDYDMDGIVLYDLTVTAANTLQVQLTTEYASAGYESHMGYVLSGTDNADGIYLEVQGGGSQNHHFAYDTPTGVATGGCVTTPSACATLPVVGTPSAVRTFTPGNNPPAILLEDPLWYAAKYGGFDDKNNNGVPDNGEWNSKKADTPDNYFLVTNALTLNDQLSKAFREILGKTASAASASVNSGTLSTSTRLYQTRFRSINWTGQLLAYDVDDTNGSISSTPLWDASASGKMPSPTARKIITVNSNGTATPFTSTALDSTRQGQLGSANAADNDYFVNVLNYLRGSYTKEGGNINDFRIRVDEDGNPNKLGDIVSSSPVFVGAPSSRYPDSLETTAYSSFRNSTTNLNRQAMIYVGANDGMLHGFNADTGVEVFGFIPGTVFGNLKSLTSQAYSHKYFVDGTPTVGDVFVGGSWKTMLVGGLNKGGQGIYALDITDPTVLANAETNASTIFKWEFTDRSVTPTGDKDLGYTFGKPQIVRLKDGNGSKWAAIFSNGYNNSTADTDPCSPTASSCQSASGTASLFIVDMADGSLIRKIDTKAAVSGTPNGLGTPSPVDVNGDSITDYVYAGDLLGNLWKFDLTSNSKANWKVSYGSATTPLPLYAAKDGATTPNPQPITSKPRIISGPNGKGLMVLFGTGKFLEQADKTSTRQSFYGIWDLNTGADTDRVSGRSVLTQQSILAELTSKKGEGVRVTTANALDTVNKRGWFMDLASPVSSSQVELQISDAVIRGDRVIFTTLIPDSDPCLGGGTSWIMELTALSGSRLTTSPFDINDDGKFTDQHEDATGESGDFVKYTDAGGNVFWLPVSAVKSKEDILTSPTIVTKNSTVEYKYNTGSSGGTQKTVENADLLFGRQTWRQVR